MKKHLTYLSLLLTSILLYSCGPKFNGHSEKEYEASRKIVEQKLDKNELLTLEKALRVIAAESMRLKWSEPAKYRGQSFNAIALKLINGHTYSSLTSEAEQILKTGNNRKAAQLTAEIDSLEKIRSADEGLHNMAIALFRIDSANIHKGEGFDSETLKLDINYHYVGKQPLIGTTIVAIKIFQTGTPDAIISETWQQGDNTDKLNPGEALFGDLILNNITQNDPQKWSKAKYPLKNADLKTMGLRIEFYPQEFTLDGKHITVPNTNTTFLATQINDDKVDLKEIQSSKGTLDELELTGAK